MGPRHHDRPKGRQLFATLIGICTLIALFVVWWYTAAAASRIDTTPAVPADLGGLGGTLAFTDLSGDDLGPEEDETSRPQTSDGQADTPSLTVGSPALAPALAPRRSDMEQLQKIAESTETAIETWQRGYLQAGGPEHLLPVFLSQSPRGVISCESSFEFDVIGPTHDYGYAQINRAAHHDTFETIFGTGTFERLTVTPFYNGWYSGLLAEDSRLGPWYRSQHCWARAAQVHG